MANDLPALLEQNRSDIEARIRDWMTPARFMAMAQAAVKNPLLMRCTPQSIINCILQAADAGVEIGGIDQHAVIIPYGTDAQLQIMYRGLIYRLVEAGVVSHIYADLVYQNDQIEVISGTERRLVHHPNVFHDRGALVGAYSVATLPNGITDWEILERKDIEAIKGAALRMNERKEKGAGLSPAWKYFEGEMIKKSAIRRHAKRLQGNRKQDDRLATAMRLADTQYDAETTAELTPDERPKAAPRKEHDATHESAGNPHSGGNGSPAASAPAQSVDLSQALGQPPAGYNAHLPDPSAAIGNDAGQALSDQADSMGLTVKQQMVLLKKYAVESYEDLPHGKLDAFCAEMQTMAGGK